MTFEEEEEDALIRWILSRSLLLSGTLFNFIAKTTFKDLQKKFQILITLRFLIVPLRRGSFKKKVSSSLPFVSLPSPLSIALIVLPSSPL